MGATCRSCGASIRWAKTAAGKPMPLDAEPVDTGNVILVDGRAHVLDLEHEAVNHLARFVSHFATCPNAAQHRKPKEIR